MRIIAGKYGSRRITTLSGDNTRPTLDKIKEALFSSIGPYFDGGKMLDLFGGSGAVAFEGLSRGIDEAVICDNNPGALKVIQDNLKTLDLKHQVRLIKQDYRMALKQLSDEQFDFIYIDPPYALKVHEMVLEWLNEHNMLRDSGVVTVETAKEDSFKESYGALIKQRERVYGITRITYFRKEHL